MRPVILSAALLGGAAIVALRGGTAEVAPRCEYERGMALVPAGTVAVGRDDAGASSPIVHIASFRIDRTEVTVQEFGRFVAATGYVTEAERQGYGAVFVASPASANAADGEWWHVVKGANWRHPNGPGAPPARADHPVTQITYADANAFATWQGSSLPTEAQWERAARGDSNAAQVPKAWAFDRSGKAIANTWQGYFPFTNTASDGFRGIAPAGCFPPNSIGAYDMIGNVWEWTSGGPDNVPVIKGGSYLCSENYCSNYRPAARIAQERDLPTSHIGFRTVRADTRPDRS